MIKISTISRELLVKSRNQNIFRYVNKGGGMGGDDGDLSPPLFDRDWKQKWMNVLQNISETEKLKL